MLVVVRLPLNFQCITRFAIAFRANANAQILTNYFAIAQEVDRFRKLHRKIFFNYKSRPYLAFQHFFFHCCCCWIVFFFILNVLIQRESDAAYERFYQLLASAIVLCFRHYLRTHLITRNSPAFVSFLWICTVFLLTWRKCQWCEGKSLKNRQ